MLTHIVNFSIRNKLIVILFTLSVAAFGFYAILKIPIGAVPDITNNQIQVITTSTNLSTQEIEQFITAPVELEMANLPGVTEIRSISKFGLSVVTIVFEDNLGTYLPRQLIAEKIKSASANIPEGFGTPEMGPITTGLGEIYQYILDVKPGYEDRYTPTSLRTIQDWMVRRQLSGIPGVVEVNSWGGFLKQYEVAIDPGRLRSLNVTLMEVFTALEANNTITGGSYIEKNNQSYFIRGDGQVKSLADIGSIVVRQNGTVPIQVKDVATVDFGHANRYGAITANGEGEKVLGQIMMLKDANSKLVINAVKERVAEIQTNLPEGVFINPILERSELIAKTSFTVAENLILGCLIVVIIVIILLGNLRSALVIASMIPLALLFTISMMYLFGLDANLMSLGALDFGIIIDGAVIIVEYIALQLTFKRSEYDASSGDKRQLLMDQTTAAGASKMMSSAIFGQIIILIVFIPILSLTGVEGKMFKPMALSFSFAIIGAMLFGFTWLPVAASLFLKPGKENPKNLSTWIMNLAYRSYTPVMKWACCHKGLVLGAALLTLILTGTLFTRLGSEFVPTLDEGDFVIQPVLKTGTSLTKTVETTTQMEQILLAQFTEVDQIVCRIGAAEVPTDPMSMEEIDMIIKLKPRDQWVVADNKEELAEHFKEALSIIPGIEYEFTQPIEMRFNELITGVRADIAIKLFGEDLNYLDQKASEIKTLIEEVPGAADIILDKTAGLPQINILYKRQQLANYGMDIAMLNRYLAIAFGGAATGSVFEGEKRFDLVVRLEADKRRDIEHIRQLQVPLPNGQQIPLETVASIVYDDGPAKISRENTHRRVVVSVNVRNRDLKSVVDDIRAQIEQHITLQPGNYIEYGGQFENLQTATKRLMIAVPVALLLIFIFLHFAFKSLKDAIMIFTAVPLSAVGGVLLLWMRGMPFSVSAGIGFIALFGIAVLNGIVLIEHLKELKENGHSNMRELILQGTKDRLRPVMLTAAAAAMGFLPMAISTGSGAEVQRPLATVVIGGLITSTLLTMVALPLLFELFHNVDRIQWRPFKLIRTKTGLLIAIIGLSSFSVYGQVNPLSRPQAIALALENNAALKSYALQVDKQKALKHSAFDIEKTRLFYGYDENNIADNGHALSIYGIEQNISFPTLYTAQNKAYKQQVSIAEAQHKQQVFHLTMRVSQAYDRVVFLQNKQRNYQQIDSLYQTIEKGAAMSYRQGNTGKLEWLNATARQKQVELKMNQVAHDLHTAYEQLKACVQWDSAYTIPFQSLEIIPLENQDLAAGTALFIHTLQTNYETELLKVERNRLLPDISFNYFLGTNNYAASKNYQGFEMGLAIPLFFGAQKARIKASKLSVAIQEQWKQTYLNEARARQSEIESELLKLRESIEFYRTTGELLSDELMHSAQRSFETGEIDFFQLAASLENALLLKQAYLDNLAAYNQLALELNYLTK